MQPFRLTSFFILILLLGTVVAAACNNDDRASTVAETPPPAAPTPDVEAIVETAVREMLEAIPTDPPAHAGYRGYSRNSPTAGNGYPVGDVGDGS